jgi:phenylacetate-CoA ligase
MHNKFGKYLISPLLPICNWIDTLRHFKEIENSQWLSSNEINRIQWVKLKNLLEYAYVNVPFYHRLFKSLNTTPGDISTPENFRKLPLLGKEDIRNNTSYIVSPNYPARDLMPNSTGGSTGVNLTFFNDRKNFGKVRAFDLRSRRWAGLELGDKNAILWGSTFDISLQGTLKNKIYNQLVRTMFLSSYNLSEENMYVYARRILQYRPKVIVGYPSPLYHFAKFLEEKGIKGLRPRSIISSAEVLYDYQKELIESVFQCKVFNRYGCREFSTIAQECSEHLGMHINAEHVYVECLNRDGNPTAPGERGELVITDLDNYGMPFIRYSIGDIGILSERKCNCGRGLPILEKIEGRTFDIIVGVNGKAVGGTFWTLLFRTAIQGVLQFQVVQESMNEIEVKIIPDETFEEGQVNLLTKKIRAYLGEDMNIRFQIVDKIPLAKSGKSRFVISKVAPSLTSRKNLEA